MTDSNGDTVWRGASSAWGRSLRESTPVEWDTLQNLRFQGQYLDRETGLHYNTFRYYDPAGGCYTQMDPIGLLGGLNTYTYVIDPLGWVDPQGLSCEPTVAPPHKVINALRDFKGKNFVFGNNIFKLDKKGMKHILERHHPEYWDGSVKAKQSFLNNNMSIEEVQTALKDVLYQNRDVLATKGTKGMYQVTGNYNGVDYVLGVKNGRVGQFYPL